MKREVKSEYFSESGSKKWSTFSKVLQKVEHLYIIGVLGGIFPLTQMYFGMDIQNAYLAEDRAMLWTLKASVMFLKTQIRRCSFSDGNS